MKRNAHPGFTLVELSIVLVILGLLVGGVLTGQSLIRAAELRSIATQESQFMTAVATFRDKYFAIPGDMPNAVRYWGAAAGGTADGEDGTCIGLTLPGSSDPKTCNGDGNGRLMGGNSQELTRFWQHLSNAALIEGGYVGVLRESGGMTHSIPGTNVPASKISGGAWTVWGLGNTDMGWGMQNYGNVFIVGSGTSAMTNGGLIKPEEGLNIDTKIDDGKPTSGSVQAYNNGQGCGFPNEYYLSIKTNVCSLVFKMGV